MGGARAPGRGGGGGRRRAAGRGHLRTAHQAAQAGAGQRILHAVLRPFKQAADGATADVVADRLGQFATLENDFAFDGFNDLQHGDLRRVAGQGKTAARPPVGTDQAGFGQMLENFGQEAAGNFLHAADLFDHGHFAGSAPGQVHQAQNTIFACAGNLHEGGRLLRRRGDDDFLADLQVNRSTPCWRP